MPLTLGKSISQAVIANGSTSNPTTTSASYVDITDMSVTLTTTGGIVIAAMIAPTYNNTVGSVTDVALSLDGAAEVSVQSWTQYTASGSFIVPVCTIAVFTGVAAGSHTVKGRWRVNSGIGTQYLTQRVLCMVELAP